MPDVFDVGGAGWRDCPFEKGSNGEGEGSVNMN
jgi:hypothetical protein